MKGGRSSALSSDVEAIAPQHGAPRAALSSDDSDGPASLLGAVLDAMTEKRE